MLENFEKYNGTKLIISSFKTEMHIIKTKYIIKL